MLMMALMATTVMLTSCDDDDDDDKKPEKEVPTISVDAPKADAKFEQEAKIELTATVKDNAALKEVEFSVTGPDKGWKPKAVKKALTGKEKKYTKELLFTVPKDALPGDYTLKIKVTDKAKNVANKEVAIKIEKKVVPEK